MPETHPNILFIMTDDHTTQAMSCYGSRINKTPNLDRIANEGMRFDNCFCTNAICEPSRASILTGTYSHVNGCTTLDANLDNSLENVAKILQRNGYQTGMVGKWHLGQGPKHWPTGFDHYSILQGQGPYFDPEMVVNGQKQTFHGYTTDIITDQSLAWMHQREKDRPFFLMCHHKAPHRPWDPDDKHKDMYKDEIIPAPETFNDDYATRCYAAREAAIRIADHLWPNDLKIEPPEGMGPRSDLLTPETLTGYSLTTRDGETVTFDSFEELKFWKYQRYIKNYLRCVASVDDNIGRMLDWLDEEGLAENTMVIYTSDQGFFLGEHGWFDKRFMYEESLRMPFLLRYPRGCSAGAVQEQIITNIDFAPTWLDYAGIEVPDHMQGYSFRPLVGGVTPDNWQQSVYYRYWMHLSDCNIPAHYGVRTRRYKLIHYYGEALGQPNTIDRSTPKAWELFDLETDPVELNNVYDNPAYADAVQELTRELARLQERVGDQPCP